MEWSPSFGFSNGQLHGAAAGNAFFDEQFTYAVQVGKKAGIYCFEIGQGYNLNLRFFRCRIIRLPNILNGLRGWGKYYKI